MTPIRKLGPPVVNVVAGQTATVNLTLGYMYHAIYLEATVKNTGQPPAISDILGDIRVYRNGKIQRQMSAVQLDQLNALDSERLRSNAYGVTGQVMGYTAASTMPAITAGTASGFTVGDLIAIGGGTLANVTGAVPAIFKVLTLSGGAPATLALVNPGQYSVLPTVGSAVAPTLISSAGTIGTMTLNSAAASFNAVTTLEPNVVGTLLQIDPEGFGAAIPATNDTATFIIGIFFADPSRKSVVATNAFAWPTMWPKPAIPNTSLQSNQDGTQQLQSLQLQIDVPNNANTSLQSIKCWIEVTNDLGALVDANGNLSGTANFNAGTSTPFTNILKWKRTYIPYTASGDNPLSNLPTTDIIQQMSFFCAGTDYITNLQVELNGTVMLNVSKNINDETMCKREMNELGLSPLRFDYIADYTDSPFDSLNVIGANDFVVTPTLATATAASKQFTLITKAYGSPD